MYIHYIYTYICILLTSIIYVYKYIYKITEFQASTQCPRSLITSFAISFE